MSGFVGRPELPPQVAETIRNAGDGLLGTAGRERASIMSTARNQLGFLESPQLQSVLAKGKREPLRLRDLKRKKTTVYLCLPAARMGTHARWLRLIINLAVAALEREKAQPRLPVLFMLEEFAALGHMRALEQASAYMAGFHLKLWIVLQDLTQLKRHYSEGWETFIANAGILQAFSVSDVTTCEYLSKRLGETTIEITERPSPLPAGSSELKAGDDGTRRQFRQTPLLTPTELILEFARQSENGVATGGLTLVLTPDLHPFVADRVHWSELAP
jgi:type IV secretion system protein VirD4